VDEDWYLRGWCHLRLGVRTFRFDRMGQVQVSEKAVKHEPAKVELSDTLFEASEEDLRVTLGFVPAALPLISDYFSDPDAVDTAQGIATIRVSHYQALVRLVSGMPALVWVVEPAQAREAVVDWASTALTYYR